MSELPAHLFDSELPAHLFDSGDTNILLPS